VLALVRREHLVVDRDAVECRERLGRNALTRRVFLELGDESREAAGRIAFRRISRR
jgi:hypothetical protein